MAGPIVLWITSCLFAFCFFHLALNKPLASEIVEWIIESLSVIAFGACAIGLVATTTLTTPVAILVLMSPLFVGYAISTKTGRKSSVWMTDYIREIQKQLITKYGFPENPDEPGLPLNVVDGEYPMTLFGKHDRVRVVNGSIDCCNFE